jgi:hypothetical protein
MVWKDIRGKEKRGNWRERKEEGWRKRRIEEWGRKSMKGWRWWETWRGLRTGPSMEGRGRKEEHERMKMMGDLKGPEDRP